MRYNRILVKLSGGAMAGNQPFGFDPSSLNHIADEVLALHKQGIQVSVVVGGGNIFRGVQVAASGMDRATGDYMGMLATVMNALALQDALEKIGVDTRVQSAIPMATVSEPYIRRRI